jgi:hypothetical protein
MTIDEIPELVKMMTEIQAALTEPEDSTGGEQLAEGTAEGKPTFSTHLFQPAPCKDCCPVLKLLRNGACSQYKVAFGSDGMPSIANAVLRCVVSIANAAGAGEAPNGDIVQAIVTSIQEEAEDVQVNFLNISAPLTLFLCLYVEGPDLPVPHLSSCPFTLEEGLEQ